MSIAWNDQKRNMEKNVWQQKKVIEIPYKSGTAIIKCKEILKQNKEKSTMTNTKTGIKKIKKNIQEVERKQMNGKTKIQGKIK